MVSIKNIVKRYISIMLAALMVFLSLPATALAATPVELTGLADEGIGLTYVTDDSDNGTWHASGDTIEGSATKTTGSCAKDISTEVTFTNEKGMVATLSFDYELTLNGGTAQLDGEDITASGSFSREVDDMEEVSFYIKSGGDTTSVKITNIKLVADVQATTTFLPAQNGSYTVDGTAITATTTITQSSTIAYNLVATPASDYRFYGWYNETTSKYMSMTASTQLNIDTNATITAKFIPADSALFDVSGEVFVDLGDAISYAQANNKSTIIVSSNGTIRGNYTIPAGMTLLIPFDTAGTAYTTKPASERTRVTPTKFRELTMASGSSLTINGQLNLSAKHFAAGGSQDSGGGSNGPTSFLKMEDNSSIVVNDGGQLYAYGFIYGDGTVNLKSGSSAYEYMQINDYRGGTKTTSCVSEKIFPFSQYYVQNVEVKEHIEYGANVYAYTSLYSMTTLSTDIHFIGDGGMFVPKAGATLTKQYLPNEDRLQISVDGDMDISNLNLSVGGTNIESADYILPINSSVRIKVNSGTTTINQDIHLQAGVEMYVAQGANVKLTNGNKFIAFDAAEFTGKGYVFNANDTKSVTYSPSKNATHKANEDVLIDINGTFIADGSFYTTTSGANIISSQGTGSVVFTNGASADTTFKQYIQSSDTVVNVPIVSAMLHNATDSTPEYTTTSDATAETTYSYNTTKGMWSNGDVATYTVTWKNDDGTTLETDYDVEEGTIPTYDGATPTKASTDQYDYTFSCWTPAVSEVTGDVTYTAQFEQTLKQYTVIWNNWDGTTLMADTVAYGTTPSYTGETPTKPSDSQYVFYNFTGWTPAVSEVTGDVTYTAQFSTVDNSALVAALEAAALINGENFSAESYEALTDICALYEPLRQAPTTQEECDCATAQILEAISRLVPYLDFDINAENGIVSAVIGEEIKAEGKHSVLFGTAISLTATPNDGYILKGWYDVTNNRYLNNAQEYSFKITTNLKLKAVFIKENSATLSFVNYSNWVQKTVTMTTSEWSGIESIVSLLPDVPYRYGYSNGRWVYDDNEILTQLRAGIDVSLVPEYDTDDVELPDAPAVSDNTPVLELNYNFDADANVGSFIMATGIPDGCNVESLGIAFYYGDADEFDPSDFELMLNNKAIASQFNTEEIDDVNIVNILKFSAANNWCARGYVTYYDADGNLKTAYSNQINIVNREQVM